MGPPSVLSPKNNFSILLQGLLTVTWWRKFWNGPQIIVMFSLSILLNFLHLLWTLTSQKGGCKPSERGSCKGHLGAWQSPLHVGAQVDPVGKPSRVLASWPWPLPTVHWWKLLLLSQRKARGGEGEGIQRWLRERVKGRGKWLPLLTQRSREFSSPYSQEGPKWYSPLLHLTHRMSGKQSQPGPLFKCVWIQWAFQWQMLSTSVSLGSLPSLYYK